MPLTSLTAPTRTKTRFETEAKFLAGDSDGTVSSLWSSTETTYAFERAYAEIQTQLAYKRHPVTRQVTYLDTAITNPVATVGIHLYELSDIESLEVHDGGGDLSAGATGSSIYVVKPREWAVIRDALNSNYYSDPTYYTLLNRASTATVAAYDIWMASPPATAGTNSIRIVHYGIEAWNTTRDAPNFGTEFDTVFTLKIAHNLRLMKDLEVNDLLVKMAPFEQRLYQATWEPKPEDDFQIACTGRSKTRTKYSTRTGWIRRY